MKIKFGIVAAMSLIVLYGCSSLKVVSDFDPSQDFSNYKVYRWATIDEINPNDVMVQDPLFRKRVVAGVENALQEKGYVLADENVEPDFVVMAHAGSIERLEVYDKTYGFGRYGGWYDPWWGPYGGSTNVSYYEKGSLVIDIVDWEQKELSWRGIGSGVVRDEPADDDQLTKEIKLIVAKILADFPPDNK